MFRYRLMGIALLAVATSGCFPASKPPSYEGTLDTNKATQLQSKVRSRHGNKYTITHQYDDKEFDANWEISNSFKRFAKVQLKPPADWTKGDMSQALVIVLDDFDSKPWYNVIDETVLRLMREAMDSVDERAIGTVPDTPYDVAVKVKKHSTEWFLEVQVQITNDDGSPIGL